MLLQVAPDYLPITTAQPRNCSFLTHGPLTHAPPVRPERRGDKLVKKKPFFLKSEMLLICNWGGGVFDKEEVKGVIRESKIKGKLL